ncbi:hypothetical protein CPB97_000584 [Podila verticillata]|nr:hypothetical protein CPB97_000584 [Podila verticillata]
MNPPTTATDAPALVDEDDVDSNDLEEMEETGFTITRRQPSLVTIEDNEDEEEEEEVPNVGARVNEGSYKWKDTTPGELRIFIGIIIYLGIFVPQGPV